MFTSRFCLLFHCRCDTGFFCQLCGEVEGCGKFIANLARGIRRLLGSSATELVLTGDRFLVLLGRTDASERRLTTLLGVSRGRLSCVAGMSINDNLVHYSKGVMPFRGAFPGGASLCGLVAAGPKRSW